MTDDSLLKKSLGGIGSVGKQLGKGISEEAKKSVKIVQQQVGGFEKAENKEQAENKQDRQANQVMQMQKTKDNQDITKSLYGVEDKNKKLSEVQELNQKAAQKLVEKNPGKTPEEIQKIQKLEQELHGQYFQQLINPPKPKEERPAEKVEKEDEEKKMKELEKAKKEEKKKPIAVDNAEHKTERRPGAG